MEKFARFYKKFNTVSIFFAAASIALMMVSTTLDTSIRYAFNYPVPGVFELNEVLLVIVVFLGISWTQEERGHTRVVLGMRRLSMRNAVKLDTLCWIICFIFLLIMCWQTGKEALRAFDIREFRWGSVQMPIWWAKGLVSVGCGLTCIQLIIDIWTNIGRLKGKFPLDVPGLRDVKE